MQEFEVVLWINEEGSVTRFVKSHREALLALALMATDAEINGWKIRGGEFREKGFDPTKAAV